MNSGIRAVGLLPYRGHHHVSALANDLNILPIEKMRDKILLIEAWKRRHSLLPSTLLPGPITRARAIGNQPLLDMRGHAGKSLKHIILPYWNKLPFNTKLEEVKKKAVRSILQLL